MVLYKTGKFLQARVVQVAFKFGKQETNCTGISTEMLVYEDMTSCTDLARH